MVPLFNGFMTLLHVLCNYTMLQGHFPFMKHQICLTVLHNRIMALRIEEKQDYGVITKMMSLRVTCDENGFKLRSILLCERGFPFVLRQKL